VKHWPNGVWQGETMPGGHNAPGRANIN